MNTNASKKTSPTDEFYGSLQLAFDHFNKELFGNSLPQCLITAQRGKNTTGFFSPNRWGNETGQKAHEISINPAYFANHKVIEIFQALVHEQCHLWQFSHGQPSRSGYHNKEWSKKMESIGLIPSHTGLPNGSRTGQKMSDYPAPNGRFLKSCRQLVKNGYQLNWVDLIPAIPEPAQSRVMELSTPLLQSEIILRTNVSSIIPNLLPKETVSKEKTTKSKIKYHCNSCGGNAWGKPDLKILCGNRACKKNKYLEIDISHQ